MENSIIQKTDNWLRDPKRLYVVGLAIFNLCASVPMKKGYGAYLNDFDEEVKPFDARFNLLINKVSAIHQNMKVAPQKYLEIDSQESIVSKQVRAIVSIKAEQDKVYQDIAAINGKVEKVAVLNTALSEKSTKLQELQDRKKALETKLDDLVASSGENEAQTAGLQSRIEEKETSITTIGSEIEGLNGQVKALENSGEDKSAEIKALNKQIASLTGKVKTLTKEKAELAAKLEAAVTEKESLETQSGELHEEIDSLTAGIDTLSEEKEELETEVDELQEEIENKDSQIETLENSLKAKSTEYDELKKELENKGYSIISDDNLPEDLQAKKQRIKEIVPLMAKIHAELSDPALTDKERKAKAEELCALDDERRNNWDEIDEYLSSGKQVFAEDKKLQYSDVLEIKNSQIALRVKRLKEKISRNKEFAQAHAEKGKANLEAKALERVALYRAELAELQLEQDETK